MGEATEPSPYATVDELLADVPTAEHDLDIGRRRIRIRIPTTYSDTFDFDRRSVEWVKLIKSGKGPAALKGLVKKKDYELAAIFTLTEMCVIPPIDALQADRMLGDGIKVKAIIRSIENLRVQHLQAGIEEAIEEGKDD